MPLIGQETLSKLRSAGTDVEFWSIARKIGDSDLAPGTAPFLKPVGTWARKLNEAAGDLLLPRGEGVLAVEIHRQLVRWDGSPISRREASDQLLWISLSCVELLSYVERRWKRRALPASRERVLTSAIGKHALMRLWWGAELLRVGNDYSRVTDFFKLSDAVQFLPYRFMRIRPLATAYTEVLKNKGSGAQQDFSRALNRFGGDFPFEEFCSPDDWSKDLHARAVATLKEVAALVPSMNT